MKVSLSWLRDYVNLRVGPEKLAEELTMAGLEVTSIYKFGEEVVFDIEVTPNRTDCLSVVGIAREVAAITVLQGTGRKKLKLPKALTCPAQTVRRKSRKLKIEIKDKQGCSRYIGRLIVNVKVAPSPAWLKNRLNTLGVRTVNNIVDITNYCLLELGQPLHAFDYDKLEGGKVIVRRAVKGEAMTTIDGVRRELDEGILVIADKVKPVAIAGLMGGKDTGVSENTRRILLESAYFDPLTIRKVSKQLGLATESSYRFERGVNWETVFFASKRAAEMVAQFAKGRERAVVDVFYSCPKACARQGRHKKGHKKAISINLPLELVNKILGVSIPAAKVKQILGNLQFAVSRGKSKNELKVNAPFFRQDVARPIDLVEEVARIYGYDKIPVTMLKSVVPNLSTAGYSAVSLIRKKSKIEEKTKEILAGLGFNEAISFSLISRNLLAKTNLPVPTLPAGHSVKKGAYFGVGETEIVVVENPISYEQEIMRPTLIPGLLDIIAWNLNRKAERVKIFELSSVYLKEKTKYSKGNGFAEKKRLTFAISGKVFEDWVRKVKAEADFFDLKGALETLLERLGIREYEFKSTESPLFCPGKAAVLVLKDKAECLPSRAQAVGREVGLLGEVKKEILEEFDIDRPVYLTEIDFEEILPQISGEGEFCKIPKQPSVSRDIALIIKNEVPSQKIISIIKKKGGDIVNKVKFFDQYIGEQIPPGFRSLAYSIEYQDKEKTLQDEEVNQIHSLICKELNEELGAQIRSS